MTRVQARDTAREILEIIPLVMRTVAAELRAAGEMPAPAHFGLLSILSVRPRMLTDLASVQGVSLPTMSNSISAMVERPISLLGEMTHRSAQPWCSGWGRSGPTHERPFPPASRSTISRCGQPCVEVASGAV